MRKTLMALALVAGSLGALAGSLANAQAADQPYQYYKKAAEPSVFNWSGFYVKGDVGYALGDVDFSGFGQSVTVEPRGVTAGVGIGYDWQISQNWVVGIGLDANWLGAKQSTGIGGVASITGDLDYYGVLKAKVGYSFGTWQIFATGGYAYGHLGSGISVVNLSADDFIGGWAYGMGAEFALTRNVALTLAWERVDFGTGSQNYGPGSLATDAVLDTYKAGVKWRL